MVFLRTRILGLLGNWSLAFFVSLARRVVFKSGLGPTAEVLSFAPPKESTQRKGGPDAAYSLRSSLLNGVA
jgi:hypothetical protein